MAYYRGLRSEDSLVTHNNPDGRERLLAVSELEVSLWGLTAPPAGLVVARTRG